MVLNRRIAERGRYPAVDLLKSISRSLPACATSDENNLISKCRNIIATWERAEMMVQAGLYASGSDASIDAAIKIWPLLDDFISLDDDSRNTVKSFKMLSKVFD